MSMRGKAAMPGWVRWFMGAGVVLAIVVVAMLVTGHGPWEHMHMSGM